MDIARGAFGDVGGGTKPIDQLLAQQQVRILPDAFPLAGSFRLARRGDGQGFRNHLGVSKMLVLSRKKDGVVRIGDDIQVYVIEIRGDKVRLGFTAPPGVSIHREEIYNKIKESTTEDCTLAVAIAGVISRAKAGDA